MKPICSVNLLTQVTGKRYADWLSEKIWQPLGLKDAEMYLDRPGGHVMTSCLHSVAPFVRLGMLMRDKGRVGENPAYTRKLDQ